MELKENEIKEQTQQKPKFVYTQEEQELSKIELEKNTFLRLIKVGNKEVVDIRKFYKNYPTKRGIRIPKELLELVIEIINKNK